MSSVGKAKGTGTVQRGEGKMFDRVTWPTAKWTHGLIHKLFQVTVDLSWAGGGNVCSVAPEGTVRTSGGEPWRTESSTVREALSSRVFQMLEGHSERPWLATGLMVHTHIAGGLPLVLFRVQTQDRPNP